MFELRIPGGRILDVGSATDEFLAQANKMGLDAYGVELSNFGVERSLDRGLQSTRGTLWSERRLPGSFDGIHMNHVLEHLDDPLSALERSYSLLRPGGSGFAYIEVPYQFDVLVDLLARMRRKRQPSGPFSIHHMSFFTPTPLRKVLHTAGFELISETPYQPCGRSGRERTLRLRTLCALLWSADKNI